jgi:hypothetical protein
MEGGMHMKHVLYVIIALLAIVGAAATPLFLFDAEGLACGSTLPNPPMYTAMTSHQGHIICGDAPQGSNSFEWLTSEGWTDHYTEISNHSFPFSCSFGETAYLAFFFRFDRVNGLDVWHETDSSADKGVELVGEGVRWIYSTGHWWYEGANTDHHYTVWGGNPGYHLNPNIENYDAYPLNQGYSVYNPIQLDYERWYAGVMAVKLANDATGSFTLFLNGEKILDYQNIKTVQGDICSITRFTAGGTIAQPAYDAPPHHRKYDALMLTKTWQDIVDGGYLQDPAVQRQTCAELGGVSCCVGGETCSGTGYTGASDCGGTCCSVACGPPACIDADGDGYGTTGSSPCTYLQADCNDANSTIHPGAHEQCGNGIDEDCSGSDLLCHRADTDKDGCISFAELSAYLARWKASSSDVTIAELIEAIKIWKGGSAHGS